MELNLDCEALCVPERLWQGSKPLLPTDAVGEFVYRFLKRRFVDPTGRIKFYDHLAQFSSKEPSGESVDLVSLTSNPLDVLYHPTESNCVDGNASPRRSPQEYLLVKWRIEVIEQFRVRHIDFQEPFRLRVFHKPLTCHYPHAELIVCHESGEIVPPDLLPSVKRWVRQGFREKLLEHTQLMGFIDPLRWLGVVE